MLSLLDKVSTFFDFLARLKYNHDLPIFDLVHPIDGFLLSLLNSFCFSFLFVLCLLVLSGWSSPLGACEMNNTQLVHLHMHVSGPQSGLKL